MRNYKAVLFDFDYTLGDTESSILAGFLYAFEQMGLPQPDPESVKKTIGYPLADEYAMLTGDHDPARAQIFRDFYVARANPLQLETTRFFPGGKDLLLALRDAGVPAAIVSSKGTSTLLDILDRLGARDLFVSVTGGDMVARHKPDPEGLLAAVAAMGLAPGEVLYCGDTVLDAGAAQGAGAPFCAVLNGATPAAAFADYPCDYIAPDLTQLQVWLGL